MAGTMKKVKLSRAEQIVLRQIGRSRNLAPTQIFTQTGADFLAGNIKETLSNLENSQLVRATRKRLGGEENPFYELTDMGKKVAGRLPISPSDSVEIEVEV